MTTAIAMNASELSSGQSGLLAPLYNANKNDRCLICLQEYH